MKTREIIQTIYDTYGGSQSNIFCDGYLVLFDAQMQLPEFVLPCLSFHWTHM